jgi:hypothetical protein
VIVMLKGQSVELRDGEHTIAPLPLGALPEVWPQLKLVLSFKANPDEDKLLEAFDAAAEIVLTAMKYGNEPEMTKDHLVMKVLDYGNWGEAFNACLNASSIRLVEREPGKSTALTKIQTSTQSSAISPAPTDGTLTTSAGS